MIKLPISFEEVSYFNNEYRGDLIVTKDVLYYFPHTRVNYARYSKEIGGEDAMVIFELLGTFLRSLRLFRGCASPPTKVSKQENS